MYKFFTIILFICFPGYLIAQNNIKIPEYVPQSPTAAAYARYGEIPVDYSTGVPRIEIPIHSIKFVDVNIPITLSYHASGIKVKDVATEVGLGWVLNSGGVLTANILGIPDVLDQRPFYYKSASEINTLINNTNGNIQAENQLSRDFDNDLTKKNHTIPYTYNGLNNIDFFSDRFSYSLCNGESGIFRKDFVNGDFKFLPYRPIKVINFDRNNIVMLSSNGYKHYFKSASDDFWVLDKIEAPNGEIIKYYYKSFTMEAINHSYSVQWDFNRPQRVETNIYGEPCIEYTDGYQSHTNVDRSNVGTSSQISMVVDSIIYNNEGVYFDYIKDRQDIANNQGYRLQRITVKNRVTKGVIKVFDLVHSYFGSSALDNLRLRLDALNVSGSSQAYQNVEKYSFVYNALELPAKPHALGVTPNHPYREDYWGYFNGSYNYSLFPDFFNSFGIPSFNESTANMDPNPEYTGACILKEIHFPTGGKTIFSYEQNCIDNTNAGGQKVYYGGLRVSNIKSYTDASTIAFLKTYKYGSEQVKTPYAYDYMTSDAIEHRVFAGIGCGVTQLNLVGSYFTYTAFSYPKTPITFNNGSSILYGKVTEIFGDDYTNTGKIEYNYDCTKWEESIFNCTDAIYPQINKQFNNDYGNYQPLLTSKTVYSFDNGSYSKIKSIENNYDEHKISEFNTGINFGSNVIYEDWDGTGNALDFYLEYFRSHGTPSYFSSLYYCDTKGHEDLTLLKSTTEIDYKDNVEIISKYESFDYDNYSQLAKRTMTNSDLSRTTTLYKYPYNFASSGTPNVYNEMNNRNVLSPIIEETEMKDNTNIQSIKNNYKQWSTNIIAPENIDVNMKGLTETRLVYKDYDNKGNVTEVYKMGDVHICYLWGYNQTYPVAKLENATLDQVKAKFGGSIPNLGSGGLSDTQIQALRLISGALVTTYTYAPLIGMTSQTDPNGVTTYYEYDTFGRLKCIKDDDGHILKTFEYHYKQ